MTDEESPTLMATYATLLGTVAALVTSDIKAVEVAACLSQIALGLYKDELSPDDYEIMCDKISSSRHLVKGFKHSIDGDEAEDRVLH
tara:strand:+ start:811 stop:1071 length:261 start_codon:yes stop_codon:yes gene_type:complete